MRLTKYQGKDRTFEYVNADRTGWDIPILKKLGQLEDIEDELGIDLGTLFKALKQGGVYVKSSFTEDTAIKMHSFQICGDASGITIWSQVRLNAKDYGKTWALTKEGLEK